jgi:translocation and assembly module TamB
VTGSTSRPAINGTFDIIDARAADASDGIGVSGINGRIVFDGSTARIQQFTGRLTQGGDLVVSGSVGVDPGAGFPADISIRIRNGRYLDGTMINANLNAD